MLEPEELAHLANRAGLRHPPPEDAVTDPAAFISAAVAEIEGLRTAVAHGRITGQATGIIMERFHLDPETASATLVQLSQDTNQKLYDIASDLTAQRPAPAAVPATAPANAAGTGSRLAKPHRGPSRRARPTVIDPVNAVAPAAPGADNTQQAGSTPRRIWAKPYSSHTSWIG